MYSSAGKITIIIIGIIGSVYFFGGNRSTTSAIDPKITVKKEILAGTTFSVLAKEVGMATSTTSAILGSAKEVYDLAKIVAGKEIALVYNGENGNLEELIYEIDKEEKLIVKNASTTAEAWQAEKVPIEYMIEIDRARGTIESSLYETILDQGLDERLALALAEMFAWQIDFAAQIQKGDSFKVIYEKKYRDGQYDHPGKIIAAEFINNGESFRGFYFTGAETKEGYYDKEGNSLQKVFLKAPLQYKYISSGYSYKRFNPILKTFTRHRGIDYAAPQGTPAVSVGDGTVVQAGWNGYYGISIKVRHNETYSTVYGHFMSLAKGIRVGTKVKQGQVVGYVGSTGLSTGPHLHYEMHKFGSLINPFTEKVPAGEPVKEADQPAFQEVLNKYQSELDNI
ncbi:MAG: peptidoglycan DD-metalloendopeptidase family protein [Candidatus Harrisonbacteria bacterium]|nr:peptidoglycan DD-metalloendopeptidase family protein [Candidatus Harrisonbacteria bacterium]